MKKEIIISILLILISTTQVFANNYQMLVDIVSFIIPISIEEKEEVKTSEKIVEDKTIYINEEEKLYPFKENNLYGYMDREGNVIVEPMYYDAYGFSEGLAGVSSTEHKYPDCYINTKGELVIPPNPKY